MAFHDRAYYRGPGRGGPGRGGLGFGQSPFGGGKAWSVNTWLIVINAVVFLLTAILSGSQRGHGISPGQWGYLSIETAVHKYQIWRFVTYQFLHAGLFHIFFNMLVLYFFGPMVEQYWGSRRYLAYYLISGVGASALFVLLAYIAPGLIFHPGEDPMQVGLIGASGCVFGVLVCAAKIAPDRQVMLIFPPVPMKMRTMVLFFLGIAALSVLVGSSNAGGEAAHLGGAAMGFALASFPRVLDVFANLRLPSVGEKIRHASEERKHSRKAAMEDEVDRILRKVHEQGLASLTNKEKKTLRDATEKKRSE
jgi:membrane associated rhomboid family serine protease